jgi:lysylphosphatidylglycerol synthetase-like protein (DUF2156 family)
MRNVIGHLTQTNVTELARRFGSSVSHVLADPRCERFFLSGVEGVIAYRKGIRCLVAIGDPICHPRDAGRFVNAFRQACEARKLGAIFAAANDAVAELCIARGWSAIEYGEELVFDPRRDCRAGARGREVRKNLNRAERAGVTFDEYCGGNPGMEWHLEAVAQDWLAGRHGVQAFISPIRLFDVRHGRRWIYARQGESIVGVLTLVRIERREGWVFEHLLNTPMAPAGTSEGMIVHALDRLREEGCAYATFGPSPRHDLGRMHGVGWYGQHVGRMFFDTASRALGFDAQSRFRRKFQPVSSEGSFLLFSSGIGVCEATGLMRAFNVSLRL